MKNLSIYISRLRSRFSFQNISLFWYRSYRRFFLIFFAGILISGAWFWYYNLYQYSWDERTKKAFLDSYIQETDFKEETFTKAVSSAHERQQRFEWETLLKHDLFHLDELPKEK